MICPYEEVRKAFPKKYGSPDNQDIKTWYVSGECIKKDCPLWEKYHCVRVAKERGGFSYDLSYMQEANKK